MERIEHRIYFKKNEIEVSGLIAPIVDKIAIFDRMYKLLDTISECGKKSLIEELEALDTEIMNDIDDEYEDRLTNGSIEQDVPPKKPKKNNKTDTQKSDESILKNIVALGINKNIGLSTFTELGLQTSLGWFTVIGKYRIKRISIFAFKYDIYVMDE